MVNYRNYIDGKFVHGTNDYIEVHNPADGAIIGRVPASRASNVHAAVQAARWA